MEDFGDRRCIIKLNLTISFLFEFLKKKVSQLHFRNLLFFFKYLNKFLSEFNLKKACTTHDWRMKILNK